MTITRTSSARPRGCVGVLVEDRYLSQHQPAGVVDALTSRGIDVRTIVAETSSASLCLPTWTRDLSVVLPRGRSTALMGLLRCAEQAGVPVVNRAAAIECVVDKAGMAATLAAAGVPTPASWLGSPAQLARRDDLPFPLVLKPVRGDNARGLAVVHSRQDLLATRWPEPVALAQRFHRGDGFDVKVYVAGERTWAVRRPSPIEEDGSPSTDKDPGEPVAVTPPLAWLAVACSRLFGLRLFGVDCVLTPGGQPLVVEVNDFPNYRGLHGDPDQVLADLVLACAAGTADTAGLVSA